MALGKNDFYSVVLRKRIKIADGKIRKVVKANRNFLVGKYSAVSPKTGKQKEYEAWKIVGMAKKK